MNNPTLEQYRQWIAETLGTNDMACILGLIKEAKALQECFGKNCGENADWLIRLEVADDFADEVTNRLEQHRLALLPFANAKP